jgi:antitoxin component of MazEF toxin-antitoxin module
MLVTEQPGDITKITKASTKSNSLRVTIPRSVTHQFGLKDGHGLKCRVEMEGNELAIMTKPWKKS